MSDMDYMSQQDSELRKAWLVKSNLRRREPCASTNVLWLMNAEREGLHLHKDRVDLRGHRSGTRMGSAARSGDAGSVAAQYRAYRASIGNQPERREFRSPINIDGQNRIVGYAAVFNSLSEQMRVGNRTFRERILPGAFEQCLRSNPDVKALLNHDPSLLLGRTLSQTLTLSTDAHGLRYQILPPATSYADDLLAVMRRGDLDSSSFAFTTIEDNWITESGENIREIVAANVWDVSPVTTPAYPAATSGIA